MKKSDLKTGMLVEVDYSELGLVMLDTVDGDVLAGDGTDANRNWKPLDVLDMDSVTKVYRYSCNRSGAEINRRGRSLLYERKEVVKEYTMKELQEKLGEEFKIIK